MVEMGLLYRIMKWEAGEGRILRKRLRNPFLEKWREFAKEVDEDNLTLIIK
jgi:hypothetical protein